MGDKVSVVMPCHNAEKYISRAIESILKQTYMDWELIIVDDASEDESLVIAEQYSNRDSRIKVYTNNAKKGFGASANFAIRYCAGRYIAFLNVDDVAQDRRLEKEVCFLEKHKEYGAVGSQARIIDKDNHINGTIYCPLAWEDIQKYMFFKNPFIQSSMMLRRCILDRHHIFFNENLTIGGDYIFWVDVSRYGKIQILDEHLVLCGQHTVEAYYRWESGGDVREEVYKNYQQIFFELWRKKEIDITPYRTECLINTLTGQSVKSSLEACRNGNNIIRYGLHICGYKFDAVVFLQIWKYIKKIYCSTKNWHYWCIKQFGQMKDCVKRFGNYPGPKYMVLSDKRLIYLEVPKVANCSIKASMLKEKFEDDYSVQKESLRYTVHELAGQYDDYYKFTFVRNPFERVVSCYESKYHKDKEKIGTIIKELEYDHYLFGYIGKDKGFTNFLCRILFIPDAYKDHHFKPQYNMVYDRSGKKRVDFVGKYERLDQEYGEICYKYALDELKIYNKTDRKQYMDYYNAFTARLAYFIYRKDVKYFGYEKEYQSLLNYVKVRKGRK